MENFVAPQRCLHPSPSGVIARFFAGSLAGLVATLAASGRADTAAEQEAFFESQVRPLLVAHCVECHGADDQSGELRLDRRSAIDRGGASGPIVVPGDPDKSRLVTAIRYGDSKLQMPPDGKLPAEAIDTLTAWVRRGAHWPADPAGDDAATVPPAQRIAEFQKSHWSYQPIVAHAPPAVRDTAWPRQPIDAFVLARLEGAGLAPNPQADRRALIRRAFFTLTGLPPTYEEVEAFAADESADAFPRLVDRLLDSRHYGERWARHWLDIARYADTTGYFAGNRDTRYPHAYTYRDYVIDAFNDDVPFDRFILEQIAADRLDLPPERSEALAAMGFLTVGRRFMNRQHDIIDDRIDVVTRGFLGLGVACARCHDHKYDPVPTADYYSLYGVFASSHEPEDLPLLGDPRANPQYEAFLAAQAEKQKEVDAWVDGRRVAIEAELRSRVADYLEYFAKILPPADANRVEKQGQRGPLRPRAITRWQKYLQDHAKAPHPVWTVWHRLAALGPDNFRDKAAALLHDDGANPWLAEVHAGLLASLKNEPPESMVALAARIGGLLEAVDAKWREARKADAAITRLPDDGDETLCAVLVAADSPVQLDAAATVTLLDQGESGTHNTMLGKVKSVEVTHPGAPGRGMVMRDNERPHEPVVFRRGQPENRGDRVPRRFLQVLSEVDGGQPFTLGSGRLELARAIASPKNPLTARVIVNRIWQHHFGTGLVPTPSDFGVRGEPPSHPELLDHLAAEFMADGWSIKRLQRRIMLSATWQQASTVRADAAEKDPENRLLWHVPRRRLEFEPLRDRMLMAAGTLDLSVGGRSVMIHEDATRRGLYAYMDREDVPGLLAAFDVPSPDASQAARSETTVPQQSLYLLNSGFVIRQADAVAVKTEAAATPDERVRALYRRVLARDPDAAEADLALRFVTEASGTGPSSSTAPDGATTGEAAPSPSAINPWVQLAQVLLSCNEFAFVD